MNKTALDTKKIDLIVKQNGNFGVWCNLGDDYMKVDEIELAIECYEKAIEYDPNIIEIYLNLGVAYNQKGDNSKAMAYFQKSVAIQPQYGNGWYNLGYSYGSLNDTELCLNCYKKAIQCLVPPASGAFCTIGYEFLIHNDLDNAYKSFILGMIKPVSSKQNDLMGMILLNLGHIYFLRGYIDLAKEKYQNSVRFYGKTSIFLKNAEDDIVDLININLDVHKWRALINSLKNPQKPTIQAFTTKVTNFVQNNIKEITISQDENTDRLLFYVEKENPLIGWRFIDAYKTYLNGSEEWEVIAFGLNKQLSKLLPIEENIIFAPVSDDLSFGEDNRSNNKYVLSSKRGFSSDIKSIKKWWQLW